MAWCEPSGREGKFSIRHPQSGRPWFEGGLPTGVALQPFQLQALRELSNPNPDINPNTNLTPTLTLTLTATMILTLTLNLSLTPTLSLTLSLTLTRRATTSTSRRT